MDNELAVEGLYRVVFTGVAVYGNELADVREKFVHKFELSEEDADVLFSGQNVVMQTNLSWVEAQKYQQSMKELGALCEVLPIEQEGETISTRPAFPCPECRDLQTNDICSKCGFNIDAHRRNMRARGFVELPGLGYVKERRQVERRAGADRRDDVRFEDGRRKGKDRRRNI